MKRGALALLIGAAAIFLATAFIGRANHSQINTASWVGYVRATAEAAMVGGLADWFAVTALFRRPLGLPIPHTAIIPTRKNEIGASLGSFVQENFLQPDALSERVAKAKPSQLILRWLQAEKNSSIVASQLLQVGAGLAAVLDADEVSLHLQHAVTEGLQRVDLAPAMATVAEVAMQDGRSDQVIEALLGSVVRVLETNRETLRLGFALRSPWWVPGSVDEKVFDRLYGGILDLLREVRIEPDHELRASLKGQAKTLIERLRVDPVMQQKVSSLRDEALAHPSVGRFVRSAWDDMCTGLQSAGTSGPSTEWHKRIEGLVQRTSESLAKDVSLQRKVDRWITVVVKTLVTDHGHRAAEWIQSTVEQWDPQETADRIELQIGRDLQFVRINGTIVGGLVGLAIYSVGRAVG
jgi:uncharacterized membrane-anchored protein YjiN (DUF445 family)